MGLNKTHYIVIGVRMSEEDFEEHFGNPAESDLPDGIAAFRGREAANVDSVVVGRLVHKMDKHGEAEPPVDLTAKWLSQQNSVAVALEEMGIHIVDDVPVEFQHQYRPRLYTLTSVL